MYGIRVFFYVVLTQVQLVIQVQISYKALKKISAAQSCLVTALLFGISYRLAQGLVKFIFFTVDRANLRFWVGTK